MSLGEVGRGPSEDLDLLFEGLDPLLRFTQLSGLNGGGAGAVAVFDVGLLHPRVQRREVDPEVFGDLGELNTGRMVPRDANHVIAEL